MQNEPLHNFLDGCSSFLGIGDDGQHDECPVGQGEDRRTTEEYGSQLQETHVLSLQCSPYLGDRCCEDDDLIEFANALHELIDTRPFDDINIVILALDLHWNREVGLVEDLKVSACRTSLEWLSYFETAMDQSLIQIKYQALLALESRLDWREQPLLLFIGRNHI